MAQAKTSSPEPFGNRKLPRVMLQFITDGTQGKSKKINDFEFSEEICGRLFIVLLEQLHKMRFSLTVSTAPKVL